MDEYKYHYVECDCGHDAHLFKFIYTPGDNYGVGDIVLSVQLNQWRPWYTRIWEACKYIFGAESRWGHWDSTCMEAHTVIKLQKFINKCVEEMKKDPRFEEMYNEK